MRYFFHTADGSRDRDTEGAEYPNYAAARKAAIKFAADCMSDDPDLLDDSHDFRVEVTNADDMLLFTVVTMALGAPASRHL